jgi:hypothetical protein
VFNGNYFAECTRNFSEATSTLKIKKGMFLWNTGTHTPKFKPVINQKNTLWK